MRRDSQRAIELLSEVVDFGCQAVTGECRYCRSPQGKVHDEGCIWVDAKEFLTGAIWEGNVGEIDEDDLELFPEVVE